MAIESGPNTLTPREYEQMQYEERMFEKQAQFQLQMAQLEAKWTSWLRIPKMIILLPVYCLFGVAYIVAVWRKTELGERFWQFISKI